MTPKSGWLDSDGYRLVGSLSSGPQGASWLLAEKKKKRPSWLLKCLPSQGDGSLRERVRTDLLDLASVRDPHLALPVRFGRDRDAGRFYLLRPHVEGTDILAFVQSRRPRELIPWLLAATRTLEILHRLGFLHRNVKAGNLLVPRRALSARPARDPEIVLCDPAWWPVDSGVTPEGVALAPELERGDRPSVLSDLYALGAVFYRLIAGKEVQPGENGFPVPLSEIHADVPLDVERLVTKLLNPDPGLRYPSCADLIEDLQRLAGGKAEGRRTSPDVFLGRDEELDRALSVIRAGGRPTVLALTGEAGMGKSAFLQRLALEAQLDGYRTVLVRCYSESAYPFQPLRVLAEELIPSGPAGRGLRRRYLRLLDSLAAEPESGTESEAQSRAFLQGLVSLFTEVAALEPTLLLVDEVHQADSLTVDFLATMVREITAAVTTPASGEGAPPSLVVSYRSESSFRPRLRPLVDAVGPTSPDGVLVELGPLPASAVNRWIEQVLDRPIHSDEGLEILTGLDGNPFAIREVLRLGGPSLTDPVRGKDLSSIHLDYLASLEKVQQRLLEALAVLGRPATPDVLAPVLGVSPGRVRFAVESLVCEGTLSAQRGALFFTHGSFHTWLLSHLEERKRKQLHRGVALALEATSKEAVEEIARHWLSSETPRRGVPAALEAAGRLAQGHEYRQALDLYRSVLELLPPSDRQLRRKVLEETANAHARSGDPITAAELLFQLLEVAGNDLERGRLHGRIGIYYHHAGEVARATHHLEKGRGLLSSARGSALLRERLEIESELAEIASNRSDYDDAEAICQRALQELSGVAEAKGDFAIQRERMVLTETLAHLRLRSFRYDAARKLFEESLRLGEKLDTPREMSLILNNLGGLHVQQNRFRQAIECYGRAARLSAQLGDDQSLSVIQANLAVLHAKTGNLDAADEAITRAAQHDARCDSRRSRFLRLHSSGMVDMRIGRYSSAVETFQAAITLGEELKDHFLVAFDRIFLGECHLYRGELKAAQAAFEQARSLKSRPRVPVESMIHARLALLYAFRGDARGVVAEATSCAGERLEAFAYLDAWNRVFLGWAFRLLGRTEAAGEELKKARSFFARVKVPAGEIQAQLELAALEADRGQLARAEKRLNDLHERFTPGRGVLRNPMLSGRLLAYKTRVLLDRGIAHVADVTSLLVEAESYLIGRRLRDLETLVRELRRRIRLAALASPTRTFLPPAEPSQEAIPEVLETVRGELAEFGRHLEEEFGKSIPAGLQRHLRRMEERLLEGRRSLEGGTLSAFPRLDASSILGESRGIREVTAMIRRIAPASAPVLISGETGTGKELVARAIHGESPRSSCPFLSVNCAALPEPLLEAELFGYAQGAFSGAERDHAGLLAQAEGGSFLFDEIGEMPLSLQAKILRVLDRGTFRPVGSSEDVPFDVRFLFCTNRDLPLLVEEDRFRRDLYYRLGSFQILVPPLRERIEDLFPLVQLFRDQAGGTEEVPDFDEEALRTLVSYPWPGNVRELQNVVTRLVLTCGRTITESDARSVLGEKPVQGLFTPAQLRSRPLGKLLSQLEREYILQLRADHGGDLKAMAASLGITLRALYARFRRLGIRPRDVR